MTANQTRAMGFLLAAVDKARNACQRVQQMVAAAIQKFLAMVNVARVA